jgi:hypothetical protein
MGKYDDLIDSVFPDAASRRIARAAVEQFSDVPGMDMWVRGGLTEFARVNGLVARSEMTPEEGRELLFSNMQEGGMPPHLTAQVTSWFDATLETEAAAVEAETETVPETEPPAAPAQPQPAQVQPSAPPAPAPAPPAGPSRAELQAEIAKWESAMRAPRNSPEGAAYWAGGGQGAYLAALQAVETAVDAPAPATIAGGAAAPPSE